MRNEIVNFLAVWRPAYRSSITQRGAFRTWLLLLTAPFRLAWVYTGLLLQIVGGYMSGMK